jgi:hypothetical protein
MQYLHALNSADLLASHEVIQPELPILISSPGVYGAHNFPLLNPADLLA